MKRIIKGHNSSREDCDLEITDAGAEGLAWLNIVYSEKAEQKSHIVVDVKELNRAINDIVGQGLI